MKTSITFYFNDGTQKTVTAANSAGAVLAINLVEGCYEVAISGQEIIASFASGGVRGWSSDLSAIA